MNFIISSLFILLVSLPHSGFALAKLEDAGVNKMREFSRNAKDMSFAGGDQAQRKVLHEVHSGTNPIGNSIPQQRWIPKLRNSP
ncbi:hypothetical protein I3843_12G108500 [Carya illinoinensis]|uniref:Uncharacterized protein n=1 Tax=Carya illinoinensis TaxID=32201 RepID=A0A8T1P070_CARIL|nr:hypothetical protein I3760_12G106700 [Carya illinoinensis]KAG6634310.1 hypothetical protein CIPAW_12G109800 [Carya illinoinensis]KAG6685355.1 hypothetical protein I3842_12G108200 [Carya illinoinensis]KAG7953404.1 hypothetical protein I3843_12G108500 [Carya illinoinensis]